MLSLFWKVPATKVAVMMKKWTINQGRSRNLCLNQLKDVNKKVNNYYFTQQFLTLKRTVFQKYKNEKNDCFKSLLTMIALIAELPITLIF